MKDLLQECTRPFVARCPERLLRAADLDDLSPIHEDHLIGDLAGEIHFVGHADHGHLIVGSWSHLPDPDLPQRTP